MSSKPIAGEISPEILSQPVQLPLGTITVEQLRALLVPLGLDITTKEAVDWGTELPAKARNVTRICELEQQIADLQLALEQEKKAAE